MGKATKGTLTIKHLLLIFCFLSLIQVSLSYNTDSSKYSLFCFNSCKREKHFQREKWNQQGIDVYYYYYYYYYYLFIFTWSWNSEKNTQAPTVTRYLRKIKFFCLLIPFQASKSSQCNVPHGQPFFTDHTFIRLFSRMGTKPLLSFNNYPISRAYWSRAVIYA